MMPSTLFEKAESDSVAYASHFTPVLLDAARSRARSIAKTGREGVVDSPRHSIDTI